MRPTARRRARSPRPTSSRTCPCSWSSSPSCARRSPGAPGRLAARVPLGDLARGLADSLGRQVSVALLDGSEVAAPTAGADPAALYGPLLDRSEAGHDLVLLAAGSLGSGAPWTEFGLQQADRILAVTAGGPVPEGLRERPELRGCDLVVHDVLPGTHALEGWA